jgi:glycosyltransferase involved in cell wall biosynthesis
MINNDISVIIPYYKGKKTIFNTINSVLDSYDNSNKLMKVNILVAIDSMEDKADISKQLRDTYGEKIIVIENQQNIGVAKTRNKIKDMVDSKYVLFLDQDDNLEPHYFQTIYSYLDNGYDLIVTNGYICNTRNLKKAPLYYVPPTLGKKTLLRANKISTPGQVLFSNRVCKLENLFAACSEEYKGADDWAAYVNLFLNFHDLKVKYVKEKIFNYNLHGNNYSNNWEELNNSAIATSNYFIGKFNKSDSEILKKRVSILQFENQFKKNKNIKFILTNFIDIFKYTIFHLVYLNRIIGCLHKKLIGFYK